MSRTNELRKGEVNLMLSTTQLRCKGGKMQSFTQSSSWHWLELRFQKPVRHINIIQVVFIVFYWYATRLPSLIKHHSNRYNVKVTAFKKRGGGPNISKTSKMLPLSSEVKETHKDYAAPTCFGIIYIILAIILYVRHTLIGVMNERLNHDSQN